MAVQLFYEQCLRRPHPTVVASFCNFPPRRHLKSRRLPITLQFCRHGALLGPCPSVSPLPHARMAHSNAFNSILATPQRVLPAVQLFYTPRQAVDLQISYPTKCLVDGQTSFIYIAPAKRHWLAYLAPRHSRGHMNRRRDGPISACCDCVDRRPAHTVFRCTSWRLANSRIPRFGDPLSTLGPQSLPPSLLPPASLALMPSCNFTSWCLADDGRISPLHRRSCPRHAYLRLERRPRFLSYGRDQAQPFSCSKLLCLCHLVFLYVDYYYHHRPWHYAKLHQC